jgi:hypothetical protein
MSDERIQSDLTDERFPNDFRNPAWPEVTWPYPPLPSWLAARLLRSGEKVTWVRGPRLNPPWERHVTHPVLLFYALCLGAAFWGLGRLLARPGAGMPLVPGLAAGGLVLGAIFVLGFASGYFTRLVVTNSRIVILQGYEVCRTWNLNQLPPSLIRYSAWGRDEGSRTVNLEALQTMLGGGSQEFTDSKTILAFGKQLDQIKVRDEGRP